MTDEKSTDIQLELKTRIEEEPHQKSTLNRAVLQMKRTSRGSYANIFFTMKTAIWKKTY